MVSAGAVGQGGLDEDMSVTPTGLNASLGFCLLEKAGIVKRRLLFRKLGVEPGPRTSGPPRASCSGSAPCRLCIRGAPAAPTRRSRDTHGQCGQSPGEAHGSWGLTCAQPGHAVLLVLSAAGRGQAAVPVLVSPTFGRSELPALETFECGVLKGVSRRAQASAGPFSHLAREGAGHAGGMAAWGHRPSREEGSVRPWTTPPLLGAFPTRRRWCQRPGCSDP